MTPAKSSDWQTKQLPDKRQTVSLDRCFSLPEIQRIQSGLIPEQMEDKWFIYWQDDSLFFYRSWTGHCIYIVRFTKEGDCYRMVEADVNRDPDQYAETSDSRDTKLISYLIDVLLLQQGGAFPNEEPPAQKATLMQWAQVGRAMLGQHPKHE